MIEIGNDWQQLFDIEQGKPYYKELCTFLAREYANYVVYPPMKDIFNAFRLTPLLKTNVVILGQDCYHGEGQAMGLAFSVREGIQEPPSLKNIHKEIMDEDALYGEWSSDLTRWAKQGVLLMNCVLTVREHRPASHAGYGWEHFTDAVIEALNQYQRPKVFVLWGKYAQNKKCLITNKQHLVLESAHPSPLSAHRGFFGNNHFNLINEFLDEHGYEKVVW